MQRPTHYDMFRWENIFSTISSRTVTQTWKMVIIFYLHIDMILIELYNILRVFRSVQTSMMLTFGLQSASVTIKSVILFLKSFFYMQAINLERSTTINQCQHHASYECHKSHGGYKPLRESFKKAFFVWLKETVCSWRLLSDHSEAESSWFTWGICLD